MYKLISLPTIPPEKEVFHQLTDKCNFSVACKHGKSFPRSDATLVPLQEEHILFLSIRICFIRRKGRIWHTLWGEGPTSKAAGTRRRRKWSFPKSEIPAGSAFWLSYSLAYFRKCCESCLLTLLTTFRLSHKFCSRVHFQVIAAPNPEEQRMLRSIHVITWFYFL